MNIISDHEAAVIALELEEKYDIDMNLKDMFSDELNTYFNYEYNNVEDYITFYFEQEQGHCVIKVSNPLSRKEKYEFNKTLFDILKQKINVT